jgi:hypothetical protein
MVIRALQLLLPLITTMVYSNNYSNGKAATLKGNIS